MSRLTPIAKSLQSLLTTGGTKPQYGHAQQLVAAGLGYSALASYQSAEREGKEPDTWDDVRHIVVDLDRMSSRAADLGIVLSRRGLADAISMAFSAVDAGIQVHHSAEIFLDRLQESTDRALLEDRQVISEMAETNTDGVRDVYVPLEIDASALLDDDGDLEISVVGHVSLDADTERPFLGDKVEVSGTVTIERLGARCFGELSLDLDEASVNDGKYYAEEPKRSLAQVLAEELDISLDEAEQLTDAEPDAITSEDGMIYGLVYDFTGYASPDLAAKLIAKHGSLVVRMGPDAIGDNR